LGAVDCEAMLGAVDRDPSVASGSHDLVPGRSPRPRSRRSAALALSLLLAACSSTPRTSASGRSPDPYAAIADSIRDEIAAGRLTGVSVALVSRGNVIWEDGFGWADRAAGRKATPHTAFSLASITKPFTTTAIMMMVAAGKLALDRPANDYLGADKIVDDDGPARAVTVRRLATHSSGLPTFFAMYPDGVGQPSVSALVRDYGHLVAPVGERYEYSNLALAILADIVARQSGMEFGQYLQTRVLGPLGLADSFFDTDVSRRPEMAVRYDDAGHPLPFYLTATPGSGEVYASAHDLARFASFHLGDDRLPKLLDRAQLDELHRPETPIAPGYWYAMGWQVLRRDGEPEVLYHGGGQVGVETDLVMVPSLDVACVVLSNRRDRKFLGALRDRLLQTVIPDWHATLDAPEPALQPLEPLGSYLGTWRGTLRAQGVDVPIELRIAADRSGTFAIGAGPAAPIKDLGLTAGWLSGDSRGDIASPDTRRHHLQQLSLNLKLREARIDGEIFAYEITDHAMTILPHWATLRRL
jgi:CubicO group peptidase (beta-lactamase class C family)